MATPLNVSPDQGSERGPNDGEGRPLLDEVGDVRRDELPWDLHRKLVALCRERGPLRAVLSRIAWCLIDTRAWERLGFARLSDYSTECLGVSARSVRSLAEVGRRFFDNPGLEEALVSGRLGWTKVRLLARLPSEEDWDAWIDYAERVTAEELSRNVRAVDRGSVEAGATEEERPGHPVFDERAQGVGAHEGHEDAARRSGRTVGCRPRHGTEESVRRR